MMKEEKVAEMARRKDERRQICGTCVGGDFSEDCAVERAEEECGRGKAWMSRCWDIVGSHSDGDVWMRLV